jgi:hypothetical protein
MPVSKYDAQPGYESFLSTKNPYKIKRQNCSNMNSVLSKTISI